MDQMFAQTRRDQGRIAASTYGFLGMQLPTFGYALSAMLESSPVYESVTEVNQSSPATSGPPSSRQMSAPSRQRGNTSRTKGS